jgi:sucrose-6-phosphate hydrolase SacC (GH32 family)
MSNTRYCTTEPTLPWRGALTIPREMSLVMTKSGPRLAQQPVRELSRLRGDEVSAKEFPQAGQTLEIETTFDRAKDASFLVCTGFNTHTTIGYDAAKKEIYVDRKQSRTGDPFHKDFPGRYAAPILSQSDKPIDLKIFVDRTSVEVFADGGLSVLTANTFPDPGSPGLVPPPAAQSFKVWRVNSIWKPKT